VEARPLPRRPSLEQYKKQAKDLLKACISLDPGATHQWVAQWVESDAGQEAEVQARLRGVALTQGLRAWVQREEIARMERTIKESKLVKPDPKLADAQFFVARVHGFDGWSKFARQVKALQGRNSQDARFEAAADAIVSGDIGILVQLLRDDPQLISARSQRTHNAPLLHYVAANGIEGFRQKTPKNIVEIARLLLKSGADVNAECNAYGGGSTALGLAATSVHPERAGVQEALLQILLDYGAALDKPSVAGNRHTAVEGCLWNGRGGAAKFLASRGAQLNLETAAGTGDLTVVRSFFNEDGNLKPFVMKAQLQRGFLWACEYGCADVVEFLLDHGADLRDQAGTGEAALHWAVVGGKLSTVNLLLKRGAPLEELNAYGGTALGQAGWSFANGDPRIDYVPIFETLLAAGAKIQDGWVEWLQQQSMRPAGERSRIAELFRRYGLPAT
jgi:ankyrin repeat protein